MWKIGKRLYSAAVRLFGEARNRAARFGRTRPGMVRRPAWSATRMPDAARILGAALLGCTALLSGCVSDDDAPAGKPSQAAVQLNVGARTVSETGSAPSTAESKIHTLRVYAFVGGRPAGHYFTETVTMADGKTHTFYMDLVFYSAGVQTVDFYVVANEGAMTPASTVTLTDRTTEEQLKNFSFSNQLRGNLEAKGLPMFCEESVDIDFSDLKAETPPAGSGHEGHTLLNKEIAFELQRPMAKLGVFAAKPEGETATLRITGLTMQAAGTQRRNYLMTPTQQMLEAVESGERDIAIAVVKDEVTAELAADADESVRKNAENYAPVMEEPFYPFENPWSNGGNWAIPGSTSKEHVLKIDYTFQSAAGGPSERTGYVYLPAVARNQYITICCLMHNEGRIFVEYSIADWVDDTYEITFNYPTYTNPLQPANGSKLDEGKKYPQPTIWYNSDASSEEGSYTFQFNIAGPTGQEWTPVLGGVMGTTDNYEIKVYQLADGTRRYITAQDELVADPANPYYIRVRALKAENVDKTVGLGIAYAREWSQDGSALLLINGLTHDLKWEGTEVAEYVVLKQIDIPSGHKTDEP